MGGRAGDYCRKVRDSDAFGVLNSREASVSAVNDLKTHGSANYEANELRISPKQLF